MTSADDRELVRRARNGSQTAFEEIVTRHQDMVFRIVLRHVGNSHDAEDITQQTFLSAFRNLGTFKEEANLSTWLFRIAFNASVSFFRERGRKRSIPIPQDADQIAASDGDPSRQVENRDLSEKIQDALLQLDEESRRIVVLREFGDCPYDEIARTLSLPAGTVRSKLHRARLFLKDRLGGVIARQT